MNPIDRLASQFERFPGIGPRQARRFVQYLLASSQAARNDLSDQIRSLGTHTAQCCMCYRWFSTPSCIGRSYANDTKDRPMCDICANSSRDRSTLFVVEKDADIENVERSGFKGLYFVLGGTIPLAEEHPEKFVRTRELGKRIEGDVAEGILKEVILGLSATTEGDHTRLLLQEQLFAPVGNQQFKISSLGRGLSTGSELEYADPDTITQALGSRR